MNRRDFFVLAIKSALIAAIPLSAMGEEKTLDNVEVTDEFFSYGFEYGIAISFMYKGERIRHAACKMLEKSKVVTEGDRAIIWDALSEWTKRNYGAALPPYGDVKYVT